MDTAVINVIVRILMTHLKNAPFVEQWCAENLPQTNTVQRIGDAVFVTSPPLHESAKRDLHSFFERKGVPTQLLLSNEIFTSYMAAKEQSRKEICGIWHIRIPIPGTDDWIWTNESNPRTEFSHEHTTHGGIGSPSPTVPRSDRDYHGGYVE